MFHNTYARELSINITARVNQEIRTLFLGGGGAIIRGPATIRVYTVIQILINSNQFIYMYSMKL